MHKCHFGATEGSSAEQLPHKASNLKSRMFRTSLKKRQISKIEKGFTGIFGLSELLPEVCPKTVRTLCSILQDAEE